jgi:hypothetical protein
MVVSGRIVDFPPNNLQDEERFGFCNRVDCRPLEVFEAAADPTIP